MIQDVYVKHVVPSTANFQTRNLTIIIVTIKHVAGQDPEEDWFGRFSN